MRHIDFLGTALPEGFHWFNEPAEVSLGNGLSLRTRPRTDFWQRTHYGFQRDDGHCLLSELEGDFSMETRCRFAPLAQYDQCGLMVRADAMSWIKCSVEYEDAQLSRLGSVVTQHGYSDWATQDIDSAVQAMSWRISRRGDDFLLEVSADALHWRQLRITHWHDCPARLAVGVYACSPVGEGFECGFEFLSLGPNRWTA